MAPFTFNIMDAAGYGYYRVWTERAYLLKLALIPLMIKFACTIALLVLGFQDNILRQGLVLLPGVLAEGWVLAQFLRTLLKDERWPTYLPAEIDDKVLDRLLLRARGIVAAVLAYGLIALASYALRYLVFGGGVRATRVIGWECATSAGGHQSGFREHADYASCPVANVGLECRAVLGIPLDVGVYSVFGFDANS